MIELVNTKLTDAELELMNIIWAKKGPSGQYAAVGTNDIMDIVGETWTVSTVFTLLSRLQKKGFVECEKIGRQNYYTALVDDKEYKKNETKRFAEKIYSGSIKDMFASMCDSKLSASEYDELEKILMKMRSQNDK